MKNSFFRVAINIAGGVAVLWIAGCSEEDEIRVEPAQGDAAEVTQALDSVERAGRSDERKGATSSALTFATALENREDQPDKFLFELLRVAEIAGREGKQACLEFLEEVDSNLSGDLRASAYARALEQIVALDPEWVFEQSARLGVGRLNRAANFKLLATLSIDQPSLALSIINAMEYPEERKSGVRALRAKVVNNPELGVSLIKNADLEEEVRSGLITILADGWAGDIEELIQGEVKEDQRIREIALSSMATHRPGDVLNYYSSSPESVPSQKTLSRMAAGFSSSGGGKGMEVVLGTEGFPKKKELAGMVFARWLTEDSVAASSWLSKFQDIQDDPELNKLLVSSLVKRMRMDGEIELAAEWAEVLRD